MNSLITSRPRVLLVTAALVAAAIVWSAQAVAHAPAHPAAAGASSKPKYVRACGPVRTKHRTLLVDIAEGNGKLVTCRQARTVARTYLRHRPRSFRLYHRKWSCYKSRPGPGWAYNCLTTNRGYVDVGIGRTR